jgi:hypothetical protein
MKKITVTLLCLMIMSVAFAQQIAMNFKPSNKLLTAEAAFSWTNTEHDFGKIQVGIPVTYEFTFVNAGDIPLVISTVQASCGCTVTNYTKDPIEPGSTGYVKATYNAASVGQFSKTVTVNANTENGIARLTVKGEVVK